MKNGKTDIHELTDEAWDFHFLKANEALDALLDDSNEGVTFKELVIFSAEQIAKEGMNMVQINCFILAAAVDRLWKAKGKAAHEKEA